MQESTVNGQVALVTAGDYAHLDDDLPPLVAALAGRGVDAVVAALAGPGG